MCEACDLVTGEAATTWMRRFPREAAANEEVFHIGTRTTGPKQERPKGKDFGLRECITSVCEDLFDKCVESEINSLWAMNREKGRWCGIRFHEEIHVPVIGGRQTEVVHSQGELLQTLNLDHMCCLQ